MLLLHRLTAGLLCTALLARARSFRPGVAFALTRIVAFHGNLEAREVGRVVCTARWGRLLSLAEAPTGALVGIVRDKGRYARWLPLLLLDRCR